MTSLGRASRAFIRPGQVGGNRRAISEGSQAKLQWRAHIRGNFFDSPKLRRMIDDMSREALIYAGKSVQMEAKKGIGNNAPAKTKAGRKAAGVGKIVEFSGGLYRDITQTGGGKPRTPGKPVKSWAPRRFLYNDIRYYASRGPLGPTAVIGPEKARWLNQLHEFGGSLRLRAFRIGVRAARFAYLNRREGRKVGMRYNGEPDVGSLIWASKAFRSSRNWDQTTLTRTARYPARPFMQGAVGVQKAAARAAEKFRNRLRKSA